MSCFQGWSVVVAAVGGWRQHLPQAPVSVAVALVVKQKPPRHRHCPRYIVQGKAGALSSSVEAASLSQHVQRSCCVEGECLSSWLVGCSRQGRGTLFLEVGGGENRPS